MCDRGVIRNSCGNSINENLTLADIKAGGDAHARIRQQGGNGRGEKVRGGRELISQCVQSGKDDQVPLGGPPAGRHLNAGEGQDGGESIVADTHEARGQDAGLHLEGGVKHMTNEAQHKAGLRRGKSRVRGLGRGLGLGLAGTLQCGFSGLQRGSGHSIGSGGLLRGQESERGCLRSRSRLCYEVWWGLLHLALPLWLGSWGLKVLS